MFSKIKNWFRGKAKSFFVTGVNAQYNSYNQLFSRNNHLSVYEQSLYVYKCVVKIGEKVGQINFKLFNSKNDEEIIENPYLDLLNRPNKNCTKAEFFFFISKI